MCVHSLESTEMLGQYVEWTEQAVQFYLPAPKIHVKGCPQVEDLSDIILIRTNTSFDLSQNGEATHFPSFCTKTLLVPHDPLAPKYTLK